MFAQAGFFLAWLNVNTMQKLTDNNAHNILETMFHEFNDHNFYALEFILDEFYENKELNKSNGQIPDDIDWFGLTNP